MAVALMDGNNNKSIKKVNHHWVHLLIDPQASLVLFLHMAHLIWAFVAHMAHRIWAFGN